MAHLAPHPTHEPRISQLLPTVKCSSCGQSVPLDQLGDHACAPATNKTEPTRPRVQTNLPPTPMDPLFPRRPSVNAQDARVYYDRSRPPSRGPTAPTRAPSTHSVRSLASPSGAPRSPLVPPHSSTAMHQHQPMAPRPGMRTPTPQVPSRPASLVKSPGPRVLRKKSLGSTTSSVPSPNLGARPSVHRRPSVPQPPPLSFAQDPSGAYDPRSAPIPSPPPPHPNGHHRHPTRSAPSPAPLEYPSSPHRQRFVSPEFDTKSGGAAGMAGVGRRGFAAVAHAAMFAALPDSRMHPRTPTDALPPPWATPLSSPNRPINSPPLDILDPHAAPPMPYSLPRSPPGSLPSPSHDSRYPSNVLPSPSRAPSKTPPPQRRESSATVKLSSVPFPVRPSQHSEPSNASGPLTPTSPTEPSFSSDRSSQKKVSVPGDNIKVVTPDDVISSFLGNASDDEGSDFDGLAYAQSDRSDDDALIARAMGRASAQIHRSPSISSTYSDDHPRTEQASTEGGLDMAMAVLLGSPTSTETPLSPKSPTSPRSHTSKPPMRSLTAHAVQRESSAMGGTIPRRGGTISGAIGSTLPDVSRKDRQSQESTASGLDKHCEKTLTCMRCSKPIEDKRWIRMENGKGVLCDKCWKNMYLPKCRRCNLPIEKQAVSSSDGQLKGKYHRDCFNCHTCHKPFPDKTFYVFDGKPFCDYHYHESNHSLCAAPHCGQPIEGPCAVSHTGDRYHIEHLTCEYEDDENGKRCDERLVDYWETEGRMLCERHMRRVVEHEMVTGSDDGTGIATRMSLAADSGSSSRAMKRKTRFIDLAGVRKF